MQNSPLSYETDNPSMKPFLISFLNKLSVMGRKGGGMSYINKRLLL